MGKVTDYDLAAMSEETAREVMMEYLEGALSLPEISNILSNVEVDEDKEVINFEVYDGVADFNAKSFFTEVVLLGMQICWLEPIVNSHTTTLQMFGGKEEKFYSQSAHLAELTNLLEQNQIRLKKRIRDFNYYNHQVDGGESNG